MLVIDRASLMTQRLGTTKSHRRFKAEKASQTSSDEFEAYGSTDHALSNLHILVDGDLATCDRRLTASLHYGTDRQGRISVRAIWYRDKLRVRGWLAIDPKRLVGERGFDFANYLHQPRSRRSDPPGSDRAGPLRAAPGGRV